MVRGSVVRSSFTSPRRSRDEHERPLPSNQPTDRSRGGNLSPRPPLLVEATITARSHPPARRARTRDHGRRLRPTRSEVTELHRWIHDFGAATQRSRVEGATPPIARARMPSQCAWRQEGLHENLSTNRAHPSARHVAESPNRAMSRRPCRSDEEGAPLRNSYDVQGGYPGEED